MKKILKLAVAAVIAAAVLIFAALVHAGIFANTTVSEQVIGPYTLVYLEHKGGYEAAPKVQDKIYNTLIAEFNIRTTRGFGIYFDDPAKVKKTDLRSELGCIIDNEADKQKLELVKSKFLVKELAPKKSITCELPFNNPLSVMTGIMKAYPAMSKYAESTAYPVEYSMEIYDVPGKKIIYVLR
jgi:hypothetical protein